MSMLSLKGKFAIITGGSRGIGHAIARRFANEGAKCVLIGRDGKTLALAAEKLPFHKTATTTGSGDISRLSPNQEQLQDGRHSYIVGDVRNRTTWTQIVTQIPKIDILVNAAGVSQGSLISKTEYSDINDILEQNLLSASFGCKAVSKGMIKYKSGCIINVSSVLAMKGGTGASVYAASKAGMLGLTSALSQELGHFRVRVNALVPGYIVTKMTQAMGDNYLNARIKQIPLGRMGTADEVADAAAFLAKNPYANNCILTIDGGLNAT